MIATGAITLPSKSLICIGNLESGQKPIRTDAGKQHPEVHQRSGLCRFLLGHGVILDGVQAPVSNDEI